MKLAWLLPLVLIAAEPSPSPSPAAPSWADRLAWNVRERTAKGVEEVEAGAADRAIPAFDTALRLRPEDPLAQFNAGTARLDASDPGAAPLLESAARDAQGSLAPAAWYNLGNAKLAGGDPAGAIDAYREALLREPGHLPSKHNLEVALRELQKQQKQQQQQQNQQRDQQQQEQQQQEQRQDGDEGKENQEQQQQQQQQRPQDQQQQRDRQDQEKQDPNAQQPLPQFQDQKDMTAEQAAALLQAVEDLERQQRRDKAFDQARQKTKVEKDW
jgi:hypothetical protein